MRTLIVAAVLAGLVTAHAGAQSSRLIKIGALNESWGPTPSVLGLRDGLEALGYKENEHFVLGVRFTQGNPAELPAAARDLVQKGVDVIVTSDGDNASKAAQMATRQIPIVFIGSSDPVAAGLVHSLARPGGNITGVADLDAEVGPKRLQIFRELVPGLKRVLFVYDGTNAYVREGLNAYRDAARQLGLTLIEKPVKTEDEARAAFATVRKRDVDGIFAPRHLSLNIPGFALDAGPRLGLPTMFPGPFFVERGGLASYAATQGQSGRQAARLVDRILKGAKPADLPVEQSTKFELTVNFKTARALGLTVSESVRLRADRVIE